MALPESPQVGQKPLLLSGALSIQLPSLGYSTGALSCSFSPKNDKGSSCSPRSLHFLLLGNLNLTHTYVKSPFVKFSSNQQFLFPAKMLINDHLISYMYMKSFLKYFAPNKKYPTGLSVTSIYSFPISVSWYSIF